jgi:LysR family transcriptional regulator, transcriptional activator for dmlA
MKEFQVEIPDLNDVRTFVAIGQEGTLTAAARELNLPTSTVSRALTRLEKHLDILLVRRSPRGLVMTDFGKEYLQTCKRALRTLRDGSDLLESRRERPRGLIKVACPITMARSIFAPLLTEFLARYPDLRIEIEPYASGWDQEPREEVDVFFKVRAPRDSIRRVRPYPGTKRGLFASPAYLSAFGHPATPEELTAHSCIGSGIWRLSRGTKNAAPNIVFRVVASDPLVHLELAVRGLGIAVLPLYMAKPADMLEKLIPVLPLWSPKPITLCALFSGAARLTPKVKVLLDFLGEYIGTDRDPRLQQLPAKGLFTAAKLDATPGLYQA